MTWNTVQFQYFNVGQRLRFKDSWNAGDRGVSANIQENSIPS